MLQSLVPQMPLLRRELTELANRRRTYLVRVFGAIALLTIVFIVFRSSMARFSGMPGVLGGAFPGGLRGQAGRVPGSLWALGIGGMVFQDIVPWLFRSIQLLMPALCCGTLTMEKERNTLGTLFLTRLSPFAIILEKLGSRLVPMLTFLLLTFPVLAYVYSLGGVDTNLLIETLWLLLCECLLYASIAMLCSAWFRTTVSAFMCSYVIVLMLLLPSAVLDILALTPYDIWLGRYVEDGNPVATLMQSTAAMGMAVVGIDVIGMLGVFVMSLPSLIGAVVFLVLARYFLIRRAFVASSSPLLGLFRVIDRFFVRLNDRTTRGIELIKDTNSLPAFDPIAWRERTRKTLGKARYLFRILTVLEVPTLFVCGLAAIASAGAGFSGLRSLLSMMWVMAGLILTVKASTAISSERSRETIEPLLSTPMTAAQILQEKIAGMRRLMIVLAIPLLSIHLTLLLLHIDLSQILQAGGLSTLIILLSYSLLTTFSTFQVMLLLSWVAAGLGMRFHSQTKSVLAAVLLNAAWVLVPLMTGLWIWQWTVYSNSGGQYYDRSSSMAVVVPLAVTPAGPVLMNEVYLNSASGDRYPGRRFLPRVSDSVWGTFLAAVLVLSVQAGLLALCRHLVLRFAPELLNRRDDTAPRTESLRSSVMSPPIVCEGASP